MIPAPSDYLRILPELVLTLFGVLVMLIILFEPGGVMGLLGRARRLAQRGSDA